MLPRPVSWPSHASTTPLNAHPYFTKLKSRLPQNYAPNGVQGGAGRRPVRIRVVLQEVDHGLSHGLQLSVGPCGRHPITALSAKRPPRPGPQRGVLSLSRVQSRQQWLTQQETRRWRAWEQMGNGRPHTHAVETEARALRCPRTRFNTRQDGPWCRTLLPGG